MSQDTREHAAMLNAVAAALGSTRGDTRAVVELWNGAADGATGPRLAQERLDLLLGLAALPGIVAQALGADPQQLLQDMLQQLHSTQEG